MLSITTKRESSKHLTLAAMSLGYGVAQIDVTIDQILPGQRPERIFGDCVDSIARSAQADRAVYPRK